MNLQGLFLTPAYLVAGKFINGVSSAWAYILHPEDPQEQKPRGS